MFGPGSRTWTEVVLTSGQLRSRFVNLDQTFPDVRTTLVQVREPGPNLPENPRPQNPKPATSCLRPATYRTEPVLNPANYRIENVMRAAN